MVVSLQAKSILLSLLLIHGVQIDLSHRVLIEMPIAARVLEVTMLGLSRWLSGKESACQCRSHRFSPWVGKIPWRRKWQPTPVFLPGESQGERSLVGYSPWGLKESDTVAHGGTIKWPVVDTTTLFSCCCSDCRSKRLPQ